MFRHLYPVNALYQSACRKTISYCDRFRYVINAKQKNERIASQRAYWDAQYKVDPEFFGVEESQFVNWSLPLLRSSNSKSVLELGSGYGRDLLFLQKQGFEVTGVELSAEGVRRARQRLHGMKVRLFESDAISFLREQCDCAYDAVYSNLFLNMHFTHDEHLSLFSEISRVIKTGGVHLFSVRSKEDKWYGKGRKVAEDTFDHSPSGSTLVYFSPESIASVTPPALHTQLREEKKEGEGDFPICVYYVLQLKL